MKEYEVIFEAVKGMLSPKRFKHSINVENEAIRLGYIYGEDKYKCRIAAITHDCAKCFTDDNLIKNALKYGIDIDEIQYKFPQLLHGPIAARYVEDNFEINDEDILNSICYHTTGRKDMSLLEKIIYLADVIEESREFQGIKEIRNAAYRNLDEALILSCNSTLSYIIKNNDLIHPLTIELRNNLLLKGGIYNG